MNNEMVVMNNDTVMEIQAYARRMTMCMNPNVWGILMWDIVTREHNWFSQYAKLQF